MLVFRNLSIGPNGQPSTIGTGLRNLRRAACRWRFTGAGINMTPGLIDRHWATTQRGTG